MYLGFQQVPGGVGTTVISLNSVLTIPAKATHAELQASVNHVRYTADNSTNPTTTFGHLLRTTDVPKLFLIEDLKRMKVIRDGSSNSDLFIHYIGGRDV